MCNPTVATRRLQHAPGPDGRPAGRARRALVRHLLAAAARARRLRRHARSTTRSRTSSSPSCCTSRPRTPRRTSSSTSTRPGGVVYAGLAIYDTMRFIKPDVATICCGIAMSMGSLILAGGARRQALGAAELAHPHPPADAAASRARRPTSRSTPRRRSSCASGSRRSTPSTPGKPSRSMLRRPRARPLLHARAGGRVRPDRPRLRRPQRERLHERPRGVGRGPARRRHGRRAGRPPTCRSR